MFLPLLLLATLASARFCTITTPVDMVFVIDSSSAMNAQSLDSIQSFITEYSTTALPANSRIGILQFSTSLFTSSIVSLSSVSEVDFTLQSPGAGYRDSATALAYVRTEMFAQQPFGVRVVVFMLNGLPTNTKGQTSSSIQLPTQQTAAAMRQDGIELILLTVPSNGQYLQPRSSFAYVLPKATLYADLTSTLIAQRFLCGFDQYLPATAGPTTVGPTTLAPSNMPTFASPTKEPTTIPPALQPTIKPSKQPTSTPTKKATKEPTLKPSKRPTPAPTKKTTKEPTFKPSKRPTPAPTKKTTKEPTLKPSKQPTMEPTLPTLQPTRIPTLEPTYIPTQSPTFKPTARPTLEPTLMPTKLPTTTPSKSPTIPITSQPTRSQAPTTSPTVSPKQNILMLISDDFKPIMATYKSPKATWMKNLDAIAAEGISFLNAHAQMSICGPSRASFLTSLRPDTTGIYSLNQNVLYKYLQTTLKSKEALVLPQLFKLAGYRTFGVGKVFHEAEHNLFGDSKVWTEPMYSFIAGLLRPPVFTKPYQGSWISQPDVDDTMFSDGQAAVTAAGLILDKLSQPDASTGKIEPWFLAVGLWKPHLPWSAPKKYFDMVGPLSAHTGVHDLNVNGLTAWQQGRVYGNGCGEVKLYDNAPKILGEGKNAASETVRGTRSYHATALYMDAQMGIIMDALNRSNSREDTIVVFLGDHGFHLGDHGLYGKHTNFEASTKVPFIIRPALRDNRFQRGSKSYAPVELLDLMPTLYDLAELTVPLNKYKSWEGVTLVPVLHDPENAAVKMGAISQYFRGTGTARQYGYSIRTTRYRFTDWYGQFYEFYDYLEDEWETNIVQDAAKKKLLEADLASVQKKAVGVPFDFTERKSMASKSAPLFP